MVTVVLVVAGTLLALLALLVWFALRTASKAEERMSPTFWEEV